MSEADEVASNMDVTGIQTWEHAEALVRRTMGPPSEVGHQVFDNVVEAVLRRVK